MITRGALDLRGRDCSNDRAMKRFFIGFAVVQEMRQRTLHTLQVCHARADLFQTL